MSLGVKVALSHFAVLLLAVGATVAANFFLFRKGFDQRMLAETEWRAHDMAKTLGQTSTLPQRLALLDTLGASAPVKFSLVLLLAPSEARPGFFSFPLSPHQKTLLVQGHHVSGSISATENPGVGPGHFSATTLPGDSTSAVVAYAVRMQAPLGKPMASWIGQSLGLAILPAALLATLLARHLVGPITSLRAAAARVATGDYTVRSNLQRQDELGEVSRDFDCMVEKLEADYRIRTRLLGDISHELGTPVTTLRATAEALLDGLINRPEDLQICHQSILRQVEHLSYLVCDVTELARYETGEISISARAFPSMEPLQQAVDSALMIAHKREATIEVSGQNLSTLGDQRRILQVMKNLIHNAIDHNPPGTTIWVSCLGNGQGVTYSVEDDGPEIAAQHHQSIFERFTKLDPSRQRKPGSGGLGLAIVREILRAHGSEACVLPTARGKSFQFTLQSHLGP